MKWRESYLDIVLVPLGILMSIAYHCWLWHKVRTQPNSTVIGTNTTARRFWVLAVMKDNDKKNVFVVQSLRNTIMGSTLMATSCIFLTAGLAAILSSTYAVKKPLNDSALGSHGEFAAALKYVTVLCFLVFSFFCHTLSIRFINQATFHINLPPNPISIANPAYGTELLQTGFLLNTVGNRLFYTALPLLLWIFGPLTVFFGFAIMLPALYNLDFLLPLKNGVVSAAM
ncbi:hypothetical protein SLEP1_g1926 [Rubroshorea leprosula]|uniref:DUF599 domain-containing protein n=1 Tax=Rubroshorea leprosula TaxID=152421 RepID=A0AAV5HQS4_9ROSI|nr:hypothetical protein SLEP1_g1926 [Rubroshorea leprosula]